MAKMTEPQLYNGFGTDTTKTNGYSNGYTPRINGYTQENGIEVDADAVMVGDAPTNKSSLVSDDDPLVYGMCSIHIATFF